MSPWITPAHMGTSGIRRKKKDRQPVLEADAELARNCPACKQQGWAGSGFCSRGLDAGGPEQPNSEQARCHRRPCLSEPVGKLYRAVLGRCLAGCPGVFLSEERRRKNIGGKVRKDIDTLLIHFAHGQHPWLKHLPSLWGWLAHRGKDQVPPVCVLGSNTEPGTEMPKEATLEK